MKIFNLAVLGLTAVLALSSCGKDSDKNKEDNSPSELNGVWGLDQKDKDSAITKLYFEFRSKSKLAVHFRCAFDDGVSLHAKGDFSISVNEDKKTVSINEFKKYEDSKTVLGVSYRCFGEMESIKDIPYQILSTKESKAINFGGIILNAADLNEKLKRKTYSNSIESKYSFITVNASKSE